MPRRRPGRRPAVWSAFAGRLSRLPKNQFGVSIVAPRTDGLTIVQREMEGKGGAERRRFCRRDDGTVTWEKGHANALLVNRLMAVKSVADLGIWRLRLVKNCAVQASTNLHPDSRNLWLHRSLAWSVESKGIPPKFHVSFLWASRSINYYTEELIAFACPIRACRLGGVREGPRDYARRNVN